MNLWREFKSFVHLSTRAAAWEMARRRKKKSQKWPTYNHHRGSLSIDGGSARHVICACNVIVKWCISSSRSFRPRRVWATMCTQEGKGAKSARNRRNPNIKQMEESTQNGEAKKIQSNIIKKVSRSLLPPLLVPFSRRCSFFGLFLQHKIYLIHAFCFM